jgi:hypothetical protein
VLIADCIDVVSLYPGPTKSLFSERIPQWTKKTGACIYIIMLFNKKKKVNWI